MSDKSMDFYHLNGIRTNFVLNTKNIVDWRNKVLEITTSKVV